MWLLREVKIVGPQSFSNLNQVPQVPKHNHKKIIITFIIIMPQPHN